MFIIAKFSLKLWDLLGVSSPSGTALITFTFSAMEIGLVSPLSIDSSVLASCSWVNKSVAPTLISCRGLVIADSIILPLKLPCSVPPVFWLSLFVTISWRSLNKPGDDLGSGRVSSSLSFLGLFPGDRRLPL